MHAYFIFIWTKYPSRIPRLLKDLFKCLWSQILHIKSNSKIVFNSLKSVRIQLKALLPAGHVRNSLKVLIKLFKSIFNKQSSYLKGQRNLSRERSLERKMAIEDNWQLRSDRPVKGL